MKGLRKFFIKLNAQGQVISSKTEDVIDDQSGIITYKQEQRMFHCPSCGQPMEQRQIRLNCPFCGGTCCDFCHEQRVRMGKDNFERLLILEKESTRLFESKLFDGLPCIKLIRQIYVINAIKQLQDARKKFLDE